MDSPTRSDNAVRGRGERGGMTRAAAMRGGLPRECMNGAIWLGNGSDSGIRQEKEDGGMEIGEAMEGRRKREHPKQRERDDSDSGKRSKSGVGERGERVEQRDDVGKKVVIVRFGEEEQKRMRAANPLKLSKELSLKLGEVDFAKVLPDGNLLISCKNELQAEKARGMKEVGKMKVVSTGRVGERRVVGCKGVIAGVPVGVGLRELQDNLKGGTVMRVERMQRTKEGVKTDCETVLLEFEGGQVPSRVFLGCMSYPVRAYVQRPLRCYNCQRFGHTAINCKEKRRCARCGGDHGYGDCEEGVQPRCCSCNGRHSVAFGGCEVMRREVQVQQVRAEGGYSYAEAVRIVKGQGRENRGTETREVVEEEVERRVSDRLYVEKKALVIFIAGVIASTCDVVTKMDKIKLVVKAASSHMGVEGLTWEEVQRELYVVTSSQTT